MKIFLSSLISSMEPIRKVAKETVIAFRHVPVMAEDFAARPDSPQVACLSELRSSDLVVLILGQTYGAVQTSGFSATHEEYREAKSSKPVIALVEEGLARDPRQAEFVAEVQAWEGGLFRAGFRTIDELRAALTRALSDYALATAAGPIDEAGLVERAVALLPMAQRNQPAGATLLVAIAGGPRQRLLRPIEMENPELSDDLHQAALFGPTRIFDRGQGVQICVEGPSLVLRQERGDQIRLEEDGSMLAQLSIEEPRQNTGKGFGFSGMMLVEETIQLRLASTLAYFAGALERVDRTQRLTQAAVACAIRGAEHRNWVSAAEATRIAASGSISMGMGGADAGHVSVTVRRASLNLDAPRIVEDLLVPLRRRFRRQA